MLYRDVDRHTIETGTAAQLELETRADLADASLLLVEQAKLRVDIYSRELDPLVYDNIEFIDALKSLCLSHAKTRVRILAQRPERAIRDGHGLIRLAQRISSFIELRQTAREHATNNFALMIADERYFLYREMADRFEGELVFGDAIRTRELCARFNTIWSAATQPADFRRLSL